MIIDSWIHNMYSALEHALTLLFIHLSEGLSRFWDDMCEIMDAMMVASIYMCMSFTTTKLLYKTKFNFKALWTLLTRQLKNNNINKIKYVKNFYNFAEATISFLN